MLKITLSQVCVFLAVSYPSMVAATAASSPSLLPPGDQLSTGRSAGQPAIAVEAPEFDFGKVRAGEKVEHRFKITNAGSGELRITKVKPDCGCAVVDEYPRSLAPGASGDVLLGLNVTRVNGPFKKLAVIFSNDPTVPQFTLTLKGEVMALLTIEPEGVYFGSVYGDQPHTKVITVTNNGETALQMVVDPLASSKGWTLNLAEKEAGKKFELSATFNPKGLQAGDFRKTAMLLTNIEAHHLVPIPLNAAVCERIEAMPPSLSITPPSTQPVQGQAAAGGTTAQAGTPSQAAMTPRVIRIQNYGETPVKVTEAFADEPAVTVAVHEQIAGKSYVLVASIPTAYRPPPGMGITVRTDDTRKPVVRIPIVATRPLDAQQGSPSSMNGQIADRVRSAEQMVGKDAPAFSLTTLDGKAISKQDLSGTVTVLNFFAPDCGFCKRQMPRVEALREIYEAKGVRFLNVSETMHTAFARDAVVAKLGELGVKAQAAIDENNTVGRLFGVSSFPTMFIVNKNAKVEAVNMGNLADLESRLRRQLEGLILSTAR